MVVVLLPLRFLRLIGTHISSGKQRLPLVDFAHGMQSSVRRPLHRKRPQREFKKRCSYHFDVSALHFFYSSSCPVGVEVKLPVLRILWVCALFFVASMLLPPAPLTFLNSLNIFKVPRKRCSFSPCWAEENAVCGDGLTMSVPEDVAEKPTFLLFAKYITIFDDRLCCPSARI